MKPLVVLQARIPRALRLGADTLPRHDEATLLQAQHLAVLLGNPRAARLERRAIVVCAICAAQVRARRTNLAPEPRVGPPKEEMFQKRNRTTTTRSIYENASTPKCNHTLSQLHLIQDLV